MFARELLYPNQSVSTLAPSSEEDLGLDSTLQELSLYDFQIESYRPGREIALAFKANPLLPGVILVEEGKFVGMISRQRFWEHLSRPYGLELFLKRPIKTLYKFVRSESLIFPSATLIVMAAQRVVTRPQELLNEPIVVQVDPNCHKVLDIHQLLFAQSQIHQLATILLSKLYYQLEVANQELAQANQDLELANRELQSLAIIDDLTQLANQRRLDECLNQEWMRLAREKAPLSIIMCDIDYFKKYNDTYGHPAGDRCLRQVADALRQSTRRPADLVARYGGEEFVVILPNTTTEGAMYIAETICTRVKDLKIPHENSPIYQQVTISLGIATTIPSHDILPNSLIAQADLALYQAKASGRNCVTVHPISQL